jgi:hypothetical protein
MGVSAGRYHGEHRIIKKILQVILAIQEGVLLSWLYDVF